MQKEKIDIPQPQVDIHSSNFDLSQVLQTILAKISVQKKYQKQLIWIMMATAFLVVTQYNSSHLFYMNPTFDCAGDGKDLTENEACDQLQFCSINYSTTLTAASNLYCGSGKQQRTLIQTATGIGMWFGIIFTALLSDRKGKKFCLIIGLVLLNISTFFTLIGGMNKNSTFLMMSEFILGFANKIVTLNVLIILTRFLQKQDYEMATIGWSIFGMGTSQLFIATINSLFPSWQLLFAMFAIPLLFLTVLSFFAFDQDPLFLVNTNQFDKCRQVVIKIAKKNECPSQTLQQALTELQDVFIKFNDSRQFEENGSYQRDQRAIFQCQSIGKVFILGLLGLGITIAVLSLEFSIQSVGYSYNTNLQIIGVAEILSSIIMIYLIRIEDQRKRGFLFSSFICGILAFLLLFPFCTESSLIQTIVIFFLRFFLGWASAFLTRLKVDLFPDKLQATFLALIELVINLGKIMAPSLIQRSIDGGVNPIVSINIIRLTLGTLPIFLMKQSKIQIDDSDPQNAKDSKKLEQF